MMLEKELLLIAHLRQDCRMPLTELSKKTGIPVSTIFDNLQENRKFMTRNVMLFDFQKVGYSTRATILLRIEKDEREKISEYLKKHYNVNTLCKINNGYDFLLECVFKSIRDMEQFTESLESKFRIKAKETHFIIDELKKEGFLSDPAFVKILQTDQNESNR